MLRIYSLLEINFYQMFNGTDWLLFKVGIIFADTNIGSSASELRSQN